MRKYYNKLIRDNIPKVINEDNKMCKTHTVESDEEFLKALKDKLSEECKEFLDTENVEELADILEVLKYLMKYYGYTEDDLFDVCDKKKEYSGGFEKRLILEYVEDGLDDEL